MYTGMDALWAEKRFDGGVHLPESPRLPMEFLSRSWSASALQICKALSPSVPGLLPKVSAMGINNSGAAAAAAPENAVGDEETAKLFGNNTFCFASSATSQMVLERIMAQSMHNEHEISPLTSGRLSHSSGPLINPFAEEIDSPPISPHEEYEDVVKYLRANNSLQPLFTNVRSGTGGNVAGTAGAPGGKTVGKWLKEKREKKKEECRARNAQLHAAVSVAGVAASVAAIAAAAASASSAGKDEMTAQTDIAVASAAMLVAAQCVENAEAMGAERDHLMAAITSAVNVRSHGDISTLTAAAATALRGAATLKARALKEVWNIATVIPVEKGINGTGTGSSNSNNNNNNNGYSEGLDMEENFLGACNQELLARGRELLKRTRDGELHWKIVSVYIHRSGEVVLKMKSKYMANTVTKKKKNVVIEVCKDIPAWPGRHLLEDGEQRRYFGLRTEVRGLVEFECKNQKEYDMWTQGVSRLLSIVAERKRKSHS